MVAINDSNKRIIVVYVENKPGVLNRVASLFRAVTSTSIP